MIEFLARVFIRGRESLSPSALRQAYGQLCGAVGIGLNLLLFAVKFFAGSVSGSIAITADAFNNLSDAGSSLVTLLGFRLAGRKPDPEHPFGHGRMEYISGLVVSGLILLMGVELGKSSLEKILHPEEVTSSVPVLAILAISIGVKLYMFYYNRAVGKKIHSTAMGATAMDSLSDAVSTAAVLVATLVGQFTGLMIDGWVGLLVALFILYSAYKSAQDTLSPLLGQTPDPEFVKHIQEIVLSYPEVLAIHDLVIHDYGPGRCHVSLHAEVDGEGNIYELHEAIDRAMSELDHKLGCFSVIHMDPVDTKNERLAEMREETVQLLRSIDPVLSLHDFRMVPGKHRTNLVFDVLVPFGYRLSDEDVRKAVRAAVEERHPDCRCIIQIDKSYT